MCTSSVIPLFYEKSATPAMIKHGMDVIRQAIQYLNPGQIPVTTFDRPLFALVKFVQWKWPDTYGERVHLLMLGGRHTEMIRWHTLEDVLEGSGWTTSLTESGVAPSGKADSFLRAAHLTRTRHAHQVTLLNLHNLQKEAFMLSELPKDFWVCYGLEKRYAENKFLLICIGILSGNIKLSFSSSSDLIEKKCPTVRWSPGRTHAAVLCLGSC